MARKSRKNLVDVDVNHSIDNGCYRAGAYVRISSDDKKKHGDSLETQRNIIENFIAISQDIRLCDVYTDNQMSGRSFDRPGFQKMLMDAENGKINCIIIKDLTRFGRNAIDAGYYLEKYFPSIGVRIIAVTDGFDSNEGDGGILLPLKNIISESYALDIGRKCRAVQQQNISDGLFVGRMAPFGYLKAPDDCRKLLIDEEAANTVRLIFDYAYSGVSMHDMIRRLNDAKTLTPSRYKYARCLIANENSVGGEFWQPRTIRAILSDQVYVGDMVQGKTRKINGKQIPVNADEWVCVKNTHEPIISRDVFSRVQLITQQNLEQSKAVLREVSPYTQSVLKGKVYCAKCGYAMHRHRQAWNGVYWYSCRSQSKFSKNACVPVSIRETDLIDEVVMLLHKHSEAILGKFISLNSATGKLAYEQDEAELREINMGLDKDGRMLRSLYENMVKGLITPDEFVQMKSDYENKIAELSNRADTIRSNRSSAECRAEEFRTMAEAVQKTIGNNNLTTEIVERLVDRIIVSADRSFEVSLRYFDEFKEVCA